MVNPLPVIEANGVSKSFGSTLVLDDLDFVVPTGVTGLLGSNGAGKTTLLTVLLGIEKRDEGDLTVLGVDPLEAGPAVRATLGYSPEHHHLPGDVQANDLVKHMAQIHGLPAAASSERANDALWLVGLGEERFRAIGTMSTGQRQRVKLAAAIAHDPSLLLLDEPTDGLDPVQRDEMLALIRRIGTEFGVEILLSSHLLGEVEKVCDNVVILADGRVGHHGSVAQSLSGGAEAIVVDLEASDSQIELIVDGLRQRAIVDREGSRLTVSPSEPGADTTTLHLSELICQAAAEGQAGIRRMIEKGSTLEDLYLAATSSSKT